VLGYPILSVRSHPPRRGVPERYFKDEEQAGQHPLDINDVWPENYSANSAQKVWAVKFAARHPNVALLDLSSFKCGHDAPTYGIVDSIVTASATPYAALHDIDANKPGGSIKIRVKTYAHTLKLHEEALEDAAKRVRARVQPRQKRLELLRRSAPSSRSDRSRRPGSRRRSRPGREVGATSPRRPAEPEDAEEGPRAAQEEDRRRECRARWRLRRDRIEREPMETDIQEEEEEASRLGEGGPHDRERLGRRRWRPSSAWEEAPSASASASRSGASSGPTTCSSPNDDEVEGARRSRCSSAASPRRRTSSSRAR
jgi:hypothetical protein